MNQAKYIRFLTLILLVFSIPTYAQLEMELHDRGISAYQSILISDFDFLQVGSVERLFDVEIRKTQNGPVTNAEMTISLSLQEGDEPIATIVTSPFVIPEGTMGSWFISNEELANGTFSFDGGDPIKVSESRLEDTASDLQDQILATSQIPTGTYILRNRLTYNYDGVPAADVITENPITIIISNPTLINLITPGVLLNSGFTYDIYSEQPILQWNGNSGEYQVLVFKKQNEFATVEDILNSQPIWESERLTTLSAQYPDFNALPLEYGKSYVWMVRSFISTSSGENSLNSEPWEFTLVDPSQGLGMQNMAKQELEQLLKQLLGNNADNIIRQLDGFGLSTIRVNGSTISTQELYQYIEKYRNQEKEIYDLIIRSSN